MKVVFMGTPEFSVPALKRLISEMQVVAVYSQPDKPVGRGLKMQPSPVKAIALEHGIPVFTPEKISIPEEIERLKTFDADFFVVVAYGQILKKAVIDLPRYGTINIHSSLLPRWRGAAPIQWSILGGDAETGVTTMMIVAKLDAGDMLIQEKIRIEAEDTAETVHDKLSLLGAKLIVPTLEGLRNNTLTPVPQDESKVTYAHKLTKEMEVLDWSKSAKEIDLQVRALNPWPGTKVETETGMKLKIKKGSPLTHAPFSAKTGQIFTSGGALLLQCGEGIYQIHEVQEEGKKSISGTDFLNGMKGRGVELPLTLKKVQPIESSG